MNKADWEKIQAVFHQVLEKPRSERPAFLQALCAGDEALRGRVQAMLSEDEREATALETPLAHIAAEMMPKTEAVHFTLRQFGSYHTVKFLGEGGMGIVYLAERKELGGYAAIKVLRDAWLSPARRERFLSEQRTLARLNYPSIAHLYDADALPDGTPWFAMEYVQGIPLTDYCTRHGCSIIRRLQLFRTVCDAVQYAHQQAVIHRDLKPSNILVKEDGSVRLLDFGIAKHLESLDMGVRQTITALRMMTPAYASPEQIRGEPASVQVDVYSLGVLLFELLTGNLPFDLASLSPHEAATVLIEHEAPRPSARAAQKSALAKQLRSQASRREWADLDVLCMTAMHKDPERRYRSVDALIRDVDHFLQREPLDVRRDSMYYRASTFIRRNRRAVAFVTAALLFAAALVGYSTWRIAKARDAALAEAARRERIQSFMMNLFEGGDARTGPSDQLRVISLVNRGVQEARALDGTPKVQAELYQTLGSIEEKLDKPDKAEPLLMSALQLRNKLFGPDSNEAAETLETLSQLRLDQARYDDAERLARQAIDIYSKHLPPDDPARARAISLLGMVLEDRGEYDKAIPVLQEAVRLQSVPGGVESDLSASLTELANSQFYAGHFDLANDLDQQVIVMDRRLYGESHPQIADDLINLGAVQFEWGHYSQAEQYDRQALVIEQKFYGDNNPETASAMTLLGRTLVTEGKAPDALPMLHQALAIEEHAYGAVHPRVATTLNDLGHAALQAGNLQEAQADFQRMAAICRTVYHGKHYYIGIALANLSSVYVKEKQYVKAENALRQALNMYAGTLPPNHQNVGIARVRLGHVLMKEKRYADAIAETQAGYHILQSQTRPQTDWIQGARADLSVEQAALAKTQRHATTTTSLSSAAQETASASGTP